mgnify:CR=1 FL=1
MAFRELTKWFALLPHHESKYHKKAHAPLILHGGASHVACYNESEWDIARMMRSLG